MVSSELPLGRSQLLEVVDMLEDIRSLRREALGDSHPSVGAHSFSISTRLLSC